jgi:tetratricopeptide (TPR) repeat protein
LVVVAVCQASEAAIPLPADRWLSLPILLLHGWVGYGTCRTATWLAGPPRLVRPELFGGVELGNQSTSRSLRQSLACAVVACLIQSALMVAYGLLRPGTMESLFASGERLDLIAAGLGSAVGWGVGMIEVSRRNIRPATAPPLATYTLLLRPYPTRGWIISVAARAASAQLVTFADPSGRDAWDLSAYFSALGSPRFPVQRYWTEHEHWYLSVTSAASHADQVIADVSDWRSGPQKARGVDMETVMTLMRDQGRQIAYLIDRERVAPPWLPSALAVPYSPLRLWLSPFGRYALAGKLRDTLRRSGGQSHHTQFERAQRAFEIADYLDRLHANDLRDPAREIQLERLFEDFLSQGDVRENKAHEENALSASLAQAERWLAEGNSHQAKLRLMEIAAHIPDDYRRRTETERAVQLRSRNLADFLASAIEEGNATGKNVEWIGEVYPKACHLLGWIAYEEGEWLAAISWLRRGLRLDPDHVEMLKELGATYNRCHMPDGALECYTHVLSLGVEGSSRAVALRGRGYALVELGRLEEARQSYLRSLEIDPHSAIAKAELSEIDEMSKRRGPAGAPPRTTS